MPSTNKIIAVGLLSGGLDSTLAAKLLIDQGIEVHAINFVSPFCTCTPKSMGCSSVVKAVEQLGNIPLKRVVLGDEYLQMIGSPKHGYGRGINPCLDCRVMKIQKAAEYMREIGASFLFTGEVLGQRPMSQHRRAIDLIDKDSGVGALTLRPLSAHHFEPTTPERDGLVDRAALLAFDGRSRKPQIALAKEKNIIDYPCPNGGCLLTDELFAVKLTDYFARCTSRGVVPSVKDMAILKVGRYQKTREGQIIIISRDEAEGEALERLVPSTMNLFVTVNFRGPAIVTESVYTDEIRDLFYKYSKLEQDIPNQITCTENGVVTVRTI